MVDLFWWKKNAPYRVVSISGKKHESIKTEFADFHQLIVWYMTFCEERLYENSWFEKLGHAGEHDSEVLRSKTKETMVKN